MAYSQSYWESEEDRVLNILSRSNLTQAQRESNERELSTIRLNIEQFEENPKTIPVATIQPQTVVINQTSYPVSQAPVEQVSPIQNAINQLSVYSQPSPNVDLPLTTTTTSTTTTTTGTGLVSGLNVSELAGEDEPLLSKIESGISQIGSIFGKIGDIPAQLVGGVTNVLPYVSSDLLTTSQNLGGVIPNIVVPTVTQVPSALGTGLGTGLESLGSGLGAGLGSVLSETGTGLGAGLGSALSQTGTGLGSGLQETGTGLGAGLKDLILPAAVIVGGYLLLKNA